MLTIGVQIASLLPGRFWKIGGRLENVGEESGLEWRGWEGQARSGPVLPSFVFPPGSLGEGESLWLVVGSLCV